MSRTVDVGVSSFLIGFSLWLIAMTQIANCATHSKPEVTCECRCP